jgi:nicotinamidase/pyrazinamidase
MKHGITDVYTSGIAYDFCVGFTTIDALTLGYRTALIDDASKGIFEDSTENMRNKVRSMNGAIIQSEEVKDL